MAMEGTLRERARATTSAMTTEAAMDSVEVADGGDEGPKFGGTS